MVHPEHGEAWVCAEHRRSAIANGWTDRNPTPTPVLVLPELRWLR